MKSALKKAVPWRRLAWLPCSRECTISIASCERPLARLVKPLVCDLRDRAGEKKK